MNPGTAGDHPGVWARMIGRLVFGDRRTTLKDPRQELPAGTLRAVLRQLGIRPEDLNE